MPWATPFREPIPLPGGKKLRTLRQAASYVQKLPTSEHAKPEWQLAVEELIYAAEKGGTWIYLARIGVMQALSGTNDRHRRPGRAHAKKPPTPSGRRPLG